MNRMSRCPSCIVALARVVTIMAFTNDMDGFAVDGQVLESKKRYKRNSWAGTHWWLRGLFQRLRVRFRCGSEPRSFVRSGKVVVGLRVGGFVRNLGDKPGRTRYVQQALSLTLIALDESEERLDKVQPDASASAMATP